MPEICGGVSKQFIGPFANRECATFAEVAIAGAFKLDMETSMKKETTT